MVGKSRFDGIAYGVCRCYVYPMDINSGGGTCKRCGQEAKMLNWVIGPAEALQFYVDEYGQLPEPIGPEPWWGQYVGLIKQD